MAETSSSRTPAQIEADLEATRRQLTDSVNELVAHLQPAHLIDSAKNDAVRRLAEAKTRAAETIEAARKGDSDAIRHLGIAAAGAAAFTALVVWRIVRR